MKVDSSDSSLKFKWKSILKLQRQFLNLDYLKLKVKSNQLSQFISSQFPQAKLTKIRQVQVGEDKITVSLFVIMHFRAKFI